MKIEILSALALLGAATAQAGVINLGAAGGYSVLTYNSSNVSDSAFQGAPIGVVNGNWTQSGGQATNSQQPTSVFLSPGHSNKGPSVETTVFDAARLNSAWSAATNLSSTLASLAPTQVLGSISSNTTISESAVGNYVLSISNISLNHPSSLTLSAPAGSTFVLNISGEVKINGDNGSGLLIAGGLTTNDVIYNLTGSGTVLDTAGGGNGSLIQGIVLAPNGSVGLHPGGVSGEIIAQSFSSSSGTIVTAPPPIVPVPEPGTFLPLLGVFGVMVGGSVVRRKFSPAA